MTAFTESTVEEAALAWLEGIGWQIAHGPDVAPDMPAAERAGYGEVVLAQRLRDALARLNPDLPSEALEDAFRKLTRPEGTNHDSPRMRMKYDPENHHRRSIRLKGYDYSQPAAYFVTVCAQDRACLFGDVVDGQVRLNKCGEIVRDEWLRTGHIRPNVELDAFVIMPNHVHGIIILCADNRRGTLQRAPTVEQFGKPTSGTIPTIVRLFKSAVTKRINEYRQTPGLPVWQRNYYEHIIRTDESLIRIRQYIADNPARWDMDRENPDMVRATHASPRQEDEPWRT